MSKKLIEILDFEGQPTGCYVDPEQVVFVGPHGPYDGRLASTRIVVGGKLFIADAYVTGADSKHVMAQINRHRGNDPVEKMPMDAASMDRLSGQRRKP